MGRLITRWIVRALEKAGYYLVRKSEWEIKKYEWAKQKRGLRKLKKKLKAIDATAQQTAQSEIAQTFSEWLGVSEGGDD